MRFWWMRMARSASPRRRNRLPRAKWVSTVSESTSAMRMNTSMALSGSSLSRKFRPLKYSALANLAGRWRLPERAQRARNQPPSPAATTSRKTMAPESTLMAERHAAQVADLRLSLTDGALQPAHLAPQAEHDCETAHQAQEPADHGRPQERRGQVHLLAAHEVVELDDGTVGIGQKQRQGEHQQEGDEGYPAEHGVLLARQDAPGGFSLLLRRRSRYSRDRAGLCPA